MKMFMVLVLSDLSMVLLLALLALFFRCLRFNSFRGAEHV
jgi:hypothetical protein